MRKEFLDFIDQLMKHDQKYTDSIITDDIKEYLKILYTNEENVSDLTDSGKVILKYMQDNDVKIGKAKDIANGLGVSSRTVSGSLRKLVADGFVEKVSKDPVVYAITDKGKNYKID
jgi:DNA-binding MarR family transcriptional regulator